MIKFKSLKKNEDFLKLLKKEKLNTKYFTIYFHRNYDNKNTLTKNLNISFVMKKKIGNAVIRNRIKRKLKSAVQKIINKKRPIDLNCAYIIFGKNDVYKDKFVHVVNEIDNTFKNPLNAEIHDIKLFKRGLKQISCLNMKLKNIFKRLRVII